MREAAKNDEVTTATLGSSLGLTCFMLHAASINEAAYAPMATPVGKTPSEICIISL